MDLCGPSRKESSTKENYFMLIIDDYSILTWVAFLKEKSEAFENFKIFKALTENQIGRRLKTIRSDRGGDFTSGDFKDFCDKKGIKREYTIPRTPQQNAVVERQNKSVQQMVRSMMNEINIAQTYWVEAIHRSVHIINKAHLRLNSDTHLENLLQSNTLKFLEVNAILKTMMRILVNMMTEMMKVSS